MNTRELALKTLYEVSFNGKYSNIAVKDTLSNADMSGAEKDFFTRLVYGTIDKEITLDYVIDRFSKVKLKKISRYILIILRMGIYQLKFMDSVPVSAAVNESVKLARRYGHGASAGFVNGLLRSVSVSELEYPKEPEKYLSVRYAFPEELCRKWTDEFGYAFTAELMDAFEKPRELILRPNTLKTSAEELVKMLPVRADVKDGAVVSDGFDIAASRLYLDGYFTVQDIAAMRPALELAPLPGDTVIDMCAAPGGKTTHMAELMRNEGRIFAFDIYEHKTELIRKNAERLGITIIEASKKDALVYDPSLEATADRVLCDVPCTGTGIIGRKPDIKKNLRTDGDITKIQRAILENGAKYLKHGGELVYSTCSIEKEENEGVTDAFTAENSTFSKLYEKTFYPHIDGCDGFYVCRMRKG